MSETIVLQLAGVLILGIGVQWIAWRLRLPAILLLLGTGLILGPGSAYLVQAGFLSAPWFDPQNLFGDLLLPAVSLAAALILFEGGLTLNLREHKAASGSIWLLVTVGAGITFGVAAIAAHELLGLHWPMAVLLGAILMVTGPTVIGPLLRHVRPGGKVAGVLKWEGIIIDPIGAMAALVIFEAISSAQVGVLPMLQRAVLIIAAGAGCGAAAAFAVLLFFRRHWVPDFLHSGFVLVMVLAAFAGANAIRHESGLFATTLMGIILANQRRVNLRHVMEFKESLTVLLISALFIVLGARLTLSQIATIPWLPASVFVAVLIVVARPAAVLASTCFSSLTWPERLFLMAMAPRGIVAASVASVFALRLDLEHFPQAAMLVPITFAVIIGTVSVYGLTAAYFSRRLGLSRRGWEGFLIAGAGPFERLLAEALAAQGRSVLLVDTNRENINAARMQGLPVLQGSVLSHFVMDELQLATIGRFLALTANDEVNALAAIQFQRMFSRADVYQLATAPRSRRQEKVAGELRGRELFGPGATYDFLEKRVQSGQVIRRTPLTAEYGYPEFRNNGGRDSVALFLRTQAGELAFFTADAALKPRAGDVLFSLAAARAPADPAAANPASHPQAAGLPG